MTPAIKLVSSRRIAHTIHEYTHDPAHPSFGLEAAEKLGVPVTRVYKTLLVDVGEKDLAVGVVPVSSQLSMKLIARALKAKKAKMAEAAVVERTTGYVLGGVSPLGQKRRLRTIVDSSAREHQTIFVSGGRRGLEIELCPKDLCELTGGEFGEIREE